MWFELLSVWNVWCSCVSKFRLGLVVKLFVFMLVVVCRLCRLVCMLVSIFLVLDRKMLSSLVLMDWVFCMVVGVVVVVVVGMVVGVVNVVCMCLSVLVLLIC